MTDSPFLTKDDNFYEQLLVDYFLEAKKKELLYEDDYELDPFERYDEDSPEYLEEKIKEVIDEITTQGIDKIHDNRLSVANLLGNTIKDRFVTINQNLDHG